MLNKITTVISTILICIAVSNAAIGKMFRCELDKKITFQDTPCKAGAKAKEIIITTNKTALNTPSKAQVSDPHHKSSNNNTPPVQNAQPAVQDGINNSNNAAKPQPAPQPASDTMQNTTKEPTSEVAGKVS